MDFTRWDASKRFWRKFLFEIFQYLRILISQHPRNRIRNRSRAKRKLWGKLWFEQFKNSYDDSGSEGRFDASQGVPLAQCNAVNFGHGIPILLENPAVPPCTSLNSLISLNNQLRNTLANLHNTCLTKIKLME